MVQPLEVHATSLEANIACNEVSYETRKSYVVAQDQNNGRDYSYQHASLEAKQIRINYLHSWKNSMSSNQDVSLIVHLDTEWLSLQGVRNNSYELRKSLIIEDVELPSTKRGWECASYTKRDSGISGIKRNSCDNRVSSVKCDSHIIGVKRGSNISRAIRDSRVTCVQLQNESELRVSLSKCNTRVQTQMPSERDLHVLLSKRDLRVSPTSRDTRV